MSRHRLNDNPLSPLFKWPGGKRFLLQHLLPFVPDQYGRYFEPFLGSGALFFAIQPNRAFLSDKSEDLVTFYSTVRDHPSSLVEQLQKMKNSEREYYRLRSQTPSSDVEKAARFLYLTNLSFNGIYRVNRQGFFNVPYGRRPKIKVFSSEGIEQARRVLSKAHIVCSDFELILAKARSRDFVYLDPPYTVVHGTNGFLRYNAKIFSWDDQNRLARIACDLKERGCHILMTNANHESIRKLYSEFSHVEISRPSCMAASSQHRRNVTELIITNIGRKC
jgi:DNA adenine methylase